MVVLEAAAIGAAGYGLYRGGDAAVRKGKETHKEFQRSQIRRSQQSEFAAKSSVRQNRISKLVDMKSSSPSDSSDNRPSAQSTGSSSKWPSLRANAAATSTASNSTNSVDDRHANVMARLREGRSAEKKQNGVKGKLANMFKRK
eukprot:Nitzschia sp. Nitz4//scaffold64_size103689//95174//95605//NITZ4_004449-RA/size103689-exonerate_protein2genome-gene-0.57-mRNA-1//-1//CDS//3329556169//6354//frame0